jgi:anti-sigma regulatory factor (Ser/Thr protein kinase)
MSHRPDAVRGSRRALDELEHSPGVGPAFMTSTKYWPLQSYLELGALPSAVPSARLHAKLVVGEWGFGCIADTVELIVSELVTNGVKASQELEGVSVVRLGLSSDERHVLVTMWDGNHEPVSRPVLSEDELPDLETEDGRGLFLVESLSMNWGVYWAEEANGKVVWAVIVASEEEMTISAESRRQTQAPLPRRVPAIYPVMRPAKAMNDLRVLRRVRDRLSGWDIE